MALNFGPPVIDFSPLGKLGAEYDRGHKAFLEGQLTENRQKALAGFGQNADLAQLGKVLLQSGDLEGGMSALRLQAANEGTPWQKQRAAAEDQRAADAAAETKRTHDDAERARREADERSRRPTREIGVDKYDNPRSGVRDPVSGTIKWTNSDGSIEYEYGTPGPLPATPGPQSSLDDPNSPAVGGNVASAQLDPTTTGSVTPQRFVIPGTMQGITPGSPDDLAAQQRGQAPLAALAPPATAGTTAVAAASPQATPLAPPAATSGAAVAQSAQPTVPAPPVTQAQINQGTSRIPPMTLEEQYQDSQRLGMSMKTYRAMRADLIKKDIEAQMSSGQTTDMKNKLSKARLTAEVIDRELKSLDDDVKEYGTEYLPTTQKARMQTTYTNLLMQLKEMYALGALQAKDVEMVEALLTNPTSSGWNPIEGMYKGLTQKTTTASQVAKIKQIVSDGLRAAEGSLGGDPSKVPPAPNPRLEPPATLNVGETRTIGDTTLKRLK
jgi:hypothetical protein